jgi:predicted metal-binding protein
MLRYTVRTERGRIRTADFLRDFVDVPRHRAFCRRCSHHGSNWACPEFDFDPRAVWASHDWFHLTAYVMEFAEDQPRTGFDPDELMTEVQAMYHHQKRLAHRDLMALEVAVPGSTPIGAGECDLCAVCTRIDGQPCRIPDQLVHSIEALGGDVAATVSELLGLPSRWSDGTTLPDYYLVVVGMLADQEDITPFLTVVGPAPARPEPGA